MAVGHGTQNMTHFHLWMGMRGRRRGENDRERAEETEREESRTFHDMDVLSVCLQRTFPGEQMSLHVSRRAHCVQVAVSPNQRSAGLPSSPRGRQIFPSASQVGVFMEGFRWIQPVHGGRH